MVRPTGIRAALLSTALSTLFPALAAAQIQPLPESPLPAAPPAAAPPTAPTSPNQRPEEFGQPLQRGQKVTDRPRPELDPLGIRAGSFFIYPRLELDELYNDNVFATAGSKRDDFITVVSPTLDVRSSFARHELNVRTGASVGTYINNPSENYGDYFVAADGRFDIDRGLAALGTARYEHLHEERDSPDSPGTAAHPVEFDAYTATLGLAQTGRRIGYQAELGFRREDYQDVAAVGGGTLDQDTRDVNIYSASLRGTYEITPNYQAFARLATNRRDYDNSTGDIAGNPNRNSTGYRVDVGATVDLTGVTFAELYGGYLTQIYDSSQLSNIQGIDAGARVVWNATQITSVTLDVNRQVQDANTTALTSEGVAVTSPGYLRSNVGLSVDHELLRNVLLNARASYQNDDYKGIDRSDDRFDIGGGVRYQFTRNFYAGASYTYTRRNSSGTAATGEFSRNLLLLRLGAQL